jgi:hypothetical protein
MPTSNAVEWTGEPLFYPRSGGGRGLVLGRYHYIFEKDGVLSSAAKVTEPIAQAIVGQLYPESAAAALVFIKKVQD